MTTNIKLLPLPEGYDKYSPPRLYDGRVFHEGQMRAYARANIARAVAPLQAEMEARGQRDEALLRQALKALESVVEHFDPYMGDNECRPMENARYTIAALRERLGEGEPR